MKIMVDGKVAVIKADTTFDYTAENRLFLGRDGYTLSIIFPLKDCPDNIAIFGRVNRADYAKGNATFECAIIDTYVSLFGTLSVVKISETDVECQFAEGRCEQVATDPFNETYINELDLGSYPYLLAKDVTPGEAWLGCDSGKNSVALPWINEAYPEALNNLAVFAGSSTSWADGVKELSWQPYLLYIARQICNAIGYQHDFTEWAESGYRYLIVCNTLPGAWNMPGFASALPYWTVSEFFEKLEMLLHGEFDFDHRTKSVTFRFTKTALENIAPIHLTDVVDKYTAEISQDSSNCKYIGARRLVYKDTGHMMSNFYSCDWAVTGASAVCYQNVQAAIEANKRVDIDRYTLMTGKIIVLWGEKNINSEQNIYKSVLPGLIYAKAEQTYFTLRSIGTEWLYKDVFGKDHYTQIYVLQPVNQFGSGQLDEDTSQTEEIEFCPVCISDTYVSADNNNGYMMYLSFGGMETAEEDVDMRDTSSAIRQTAFVSALEQGEKEGKGTAYYDVVYVAFWDGAKPKEGAQPYPYLDPVTVREDWVQVSPQIPDIRLYGSSDSYKAQMPAINPAQKFKFSWLDTKIPNPRAIYHIGGKRYLCEKITASFSTQGMSQLLKGEFYPIIDNPGD